MRIGFLGTGRIAAPLARAVAANDFPVLVSRRNEEVSAQLSRETRSITMGENQEVVDRSDLVFLCLRGSVARDVLPGITFRQQMSIVSVMAGIRLEELAELCSPADGIVRMIPLGFIETGGCPLPVYPNAEVLQGLFGADNPIIPVRTEQDLQTHFAAATVVPVAVRTLREAADWLGDEIENPIGAETYVLAATAGYLRSLPLDGRGRLSASIDEMMTEGGLTSQIITHLEQVGAMAAISSGLDDLRTRLAGH